MTTPDTEREALWHRVSGVLRGHAFVQHGRGYGEHIDLSAQAADYFADRIDPIIMDALAAAEHRIARLEAQADIRGRAVVIYRDRAREAEARIKAVRGILDQARAEFEQPDDANIRRALEG